MLRMANADVLPFDYSILTSTVNGYFAEIKSLIDQSRTQVEIENKLIADKVYELAADPKEKLKLPVVKPAIPFLDFSPVENALSQLQKTTDLLKLSITKADQLDESTLNKLNQLLYQAEQKLLDEKGLPRRPWYRHQIYAPGYYTGYGVKTLPGLREGIEEKNWNETKERIEVLAKALNRFDAALQEGLSILSK
jgi:N-acetylated-alpha-linked acidic dipeptidase